MRVKALRGVCIGVDKHLKLGDIVPDMEPALVTFLAGIGAVEKIPEPPPEAQAALIPDEPESKSTPAKAGRKEK
jgi:nucleoside phosphorylase